MNDTRVSVVIPTFNRNTTLARAVRSAVLQSLAPHEIIIVDDCSDTPVQLPTDLIERKNIQVIYRDDNGGAGAARNTGIDIATGDWVAFLDSDDVWYPDKLKTQIDQAGCDPATKFGAVFCGRNIVSYHGSSVQEFGHSFDSLRESVLAGDFRGASSGIIMARSAIEANIRFDESLRCHEDHELTIQLTALFAVTYVTQPLYDQRRDHGEGHLYSGPNVASDLEKVMQNHSADYHKRPDLHAEIKFRIGANWLKNGDGLRAMSWFARSILQYPRRRKYYSGCIRSIPHLL